MLKKNKKYRSANAVIIYSVILIFLIALTFFFFRNAFSNYHSFKEHRDYFRNNPSPAIESWMTPHSVLSHFNISGKDLFLQMNITYNRQNLRIPFSELCAKNKIDCPMLIKTLNEKVK